MPRPSKKTRPRMISQAELTDELFAKIEGAQGMAYFSDGEMQPTMERYWARINGRLIHARRVIRIYVDFLRKYGHLDSPSKPRKRA